MRLHTNTRYAITALLDIAMQPEFNSESNTQTGQIKQHSQKNHTRKIVPLADISKRQGISKVYLEQIFNKLKNHGVVTSRRGPAGGFALGKSASQIALVDVFKAISGEVDTRKCQGLSNCKGGQRCITHNFWSSLNNQVNSFLEGVTLQNLIDQNKQT